MQNFKNIRNAGMYVNKIHTNIKYAKFQSNILILAVQWQKKTGESDDIPFVKRDFRHF